MFSRKGERNVAEVYDMSDGCARSSQSDCPVDKPNWVGFDDSGTVYVYSDSGYVTAQGSGGIWSPVLDTVPLRKSREDSFWPIAVTASKFVAVLLKGGHEHPEVMQRPIPTNLQLRLPVARTPDVALEEMYIRGTMTAANNPDDERVSGEVRGVQFFRSASSFFIVSSLLLTPRLCFCSSPRCSMSLS